MRHAVAVGLSYVHSVNLTKAFFLRPPRPLRSLIYEVIAVELKPRQRSPSSGQRDLVRCGRFLVMRCRVRVTDEVMITLMGRGSRVSLTMVGHRLPTPS